MRTSSLCTVHPFTPLDFRVLTDPCTYGRDDCRGRENCEPIDNDQGVCRCDRFFAFTGAHCDEPSAVTYALAPLIATAVVTSVAVLLVYFSEHCIGRSEFLVLSFTFVEKLIFSLCGRLSVGQRSPHRRTERCGLTLYQSIKCS